MGWMDGWMRELIGGRAECVGVKGEHWKAPEKKQGLKSSGWLAEVFVAITESIDWRLKRRNCEVLQACSVQKYLWFKKHKAYTLLK